MQRYSPLFQQFSNATKPPFRNIATTVILCLPSTLRCFTVAETLLKSPPWDFFNCSSVDGHLSFSTNVNSLTTMAVSLPEMFDFRQATVFFCLGCRFSNHKITSCAKIWRSHCPLWLRLCPTIFQIPSTYFYHEKVIFMPYSQEKKTDNMKLTKFL